MWCPREPVGSEKRRETGERREKWSGCIHHNRRNNNPLKRDRQRERKGGEAGEEEKTEKLRQERGKKQTFSSGRDSRRTATLLNMDTLFSVFAGLLVLFSTLGNVSGQITTGKNRTQEVFKKRKSLASFGAEFLTGVCCFQGVKEKL